ncbi:hypothetical protein HanRHA438_Chr02g0058641 [Helianthus annuus]|nr:hypothetical protein HanRHA438_Chr02g0058641 [Helianthus annuus]
MYVCIGYCERKQARLLRLWGVAFAEPSPGGRCGGPAPVLAGPQPAPMPMSLIELQFTIFYLIIPLIFVHYR